MVEAGTWRKVARNLGMDFAGFNPHPEVVNRFTIQIRAFTRIRFRLIRILNRFKHPV